MGRHRFERHVGEVQLHLEAPTREELYAEAAHALAALSTERFAGPLDPPERVEVDGRDPEALLVAWVDELIYRAEISGRAFPDVHVERVHDTHLAARIRGRPVAAVRTAVKAATFHGVEVRRRADGWTARLVLDV